MADQSEHDDVDLDAATLPDLGDGVPFDTSEPLDAGVGDHAAGTGLDGDDGEVDR